MSDVHPRNPHRDRYDFGRLVEVCPKLEAFLKANPSGDQTIDFADPDAVLCLNRALLDQYYSVKHWMIPEGYLCPPIPGRADYIHHLADLIGENSRGARVLDIGTGANCIYPIIGSQAYGWKFVGSEIDARAVKSARAISEANPYLKNQVRVVQQKNMKQIFHGVIKPSDRFVATMCNPPFHDSAQTAQVGSAQKRRNLSGKGSRQRPTLNFGGQANELWCEGGEVQFIKTMIEESRYFAQQVNWFTSLVSKSEHLPILKQALSSADAVAVRVVNMQQGNKQSRFLAWRYFAETDDA